MKQIKLFSILMMLVLCCGTVFAQGITITGTITDAKTSESLPGASVVLKGTTQGTISDMDEIGRASCRERVGLDV